VPLIKIETEKEIPRDVLSALSATTAEVLGKPETYVMVSASRSKLMMSGTFAAAAFVEVRSIGGLTHEVNAALSARLCELLQDQLGILADRVYINFTDVPAHEWGWNGSLFG
jgi:phenylpyruvate tautomerase